jgi:RNA polymerase sigma-70 factor (ECF subfamily)
MSRKRASERRLALVTGDLAGAPVAQLAVGSFDDVYARNAGYVAGLVGRILGRNDEVPDVVQEVFLIAYRRLSSVRDPEAMRAWIARIAVREASRRLRWRRVRAFLRLEHPVDADLVADERSLTELRPLVALLYVALDRLPAHERVAWALRHLHDEPLDVVAELCGCSLATAKRRIAAAELALRPVLDGGADEGDDKGDDDDRSGNEGNPEKGQ